jgi:hypothetical protein
MVRWLLAFAFVAASAQAQSPAGTIDPGMTKQQVLAQLGRPAAVRSYQGTTYLLYANQCGRTCGMQDLVILERDAVVDAVFRSPSRHYTGTSSSPVATRPKTRSARPGTLALPADSTLPATTTTPPQP